MSEIVILAVCPRETTADRLDLLSVARGNLKVYSVNSKIKSSITN